MYYDLLDLLEFIDMYAIEFKNLVIDLSYNIYFAFSEFINLLKLPEEL